MPEYRFTPKITKVKAIKDVRVRKGLPTSASELSKVIPVGSDISVLGYVSDGESVSGNSKWYLDSQGDFFWSGNVTEGPQKILRKPLDTLICTQSFGANPAYYANYGSPKGHNGLDFRTRLATNANDWKRTVYAVMDGFVKEAGEDNVKGKYIRLVHPNSHETVYLHLSSIGVVVGQQVKGGVMIGVSGNSGAASAGPHLHFGYRPIPYDFNNGYMGYIDPTPYFIDPIQYA